MTSRVRTENLESAIRVLSMPIASTQFVDVVNVKRTPAFQDQKTYIWEFSV